MIFTRVFGILQVGFNLRQILLTSILALARDPAWCKAGAPKFVVAPAMTRDSNKAETSRQNAENTIILSQYASYCDSIGTQQSADHYTDWRNCNDDARLLKLSLSGFDGVEPVDARQGS